MELQEKEDTNDYDSPDINEVNENSEKRLYNDFHDPSSREEESNLGLNVTVSSSCVISVKKVYLVLLIVWLQI